MKRIVLLLVLAAASYIADAQVHGSIIIGRSGYGRGYGRIRGGGGYGHFNGGYGRTRVRGTYGNRENQRPAFQPSVNISAGYGFPNLDKQYFPEFIGLYRGTVTNQTGPFTGAIDYQFSRFMSIGVMGTYGKVNQPYYDFSNNSSVADMTGQYENWSLMLNVVSYFPTRTRAVSPYLWTAIGYQDWTQDFTNADGTKTTGVEPPTNLAYQVSLGAKFNLSQRAGIFLEAGYGKYIASGGLALKF